MVNGMSPPYSCTVFPSSSRMLQWEVWYFKPFSRCFTTTGTSVHLSHFLAWWACEIGMSSRKWHVWLRMVLYAWYYHAGQIPVFFSNSIVCYLNPHFMKSRFLAGRITTCACWINMCNFWSKKHWIFLPESAHLRTLCRFYMVLPSMF